MRYVIFRGRFQPFTRVHYECIKTFFHESLTWEERTYDDRLPWLILCIVRDYETLGSEYRLLASNPSAERFFRHLFLFNPFSILECEREIQTGIHTYIEEDRLKTRYRDKLIDRFKKFLRTRLFIEALPIKFQHLLKFNSRTTSPSDKENTYQTIVAAFREPESPSSEEGRTARNLAKLLCCLTKELLHIEECQREWLVPIFDYEDITDSRMLVTAKEKRISRWNECQFLGHAYRYTPALPGSLDFKTEFSLSPIGTCIYYTYLQWLQRGPRSTCDPKVLKQDIDGSRKAVSQFVSHNCFKAYDDSISAKIMRAHTRWDDSTLIDREHAILSDPKEFCSMARVYLAVPEEAHVKQIDDPMSLEDILATLQKPVSRNNQVFISYSQNDKECLDELLDALRPAERDGRVKLWHDKKIRDGTFWYEEIEKAVAGSRVAVLLVTRNFMASDFIVETEFRLVIEAAKKGKLEVLWIPWTEADWGTLKLEDIQALYPPYPLERLLHHLSPSERVAALHEISMRIVEAVKRYSEQP